MHMHMHMPDVNFLHVNLLSIYIHALLQHSLTHALLYHIPATPLVCYIDDTWTLHVCCWVKHLTCKSICQAHAEHWQKDLQVNEFGSTAKMQHPCSISAPHRVTCPAKQHAQVYSRTAKHDRPVKLDRADPTWLAVFHERV